MATTTVTAVPASRSATARSAIRVPLWGAVLLSRVVVLAAGAYGALFTQRVPGWTVYDPDRVSSSLGAVGNVLSASAVPWDGVGYLTLAQHGYTTVSSTRLFPLYPLLVRALTIVVASPVIAGELISLAAFVVGLTLVHRIARERLGRGAADATVLLIAFSPLSFVLSAVYTESLLLALLAGSFYLADRGRFGWACVVAAAATLTHIQGILMVAPLAIIYWNNCGRTFEPRKLWSRDLFALTLPPAALAGFLTYMHSQGWGWLAPITNQNVTNAGRTMAGPIGTIAQTIGDVVTGVGQMLHGAPQIGTYGFAPGVQNGIYLLVFMIAVLSLVNVWRLLPRHYFVFALLAILVCTSSSVAGQPLKGFDRYVLPIFPLWIGAGAWLQRRKLLPSALAISTVLLILYTVQFSRWISVF